MGEEIEVEECSLEERAMLLQQQMNFFAGYALAIAQSCGLSPQHAGDMFYSGLPQGKPPRKVQAGELAQIARTTAKFVRTIGSDVRLLPMDAGWNLVISLNSDLRAALDCWGVPLDYYVGWLTAVEQHEGEKIQVEWNTRLEGDAVHMEIRPISEL